MAVDEPIVRAGKQQQVLTQLKEYAQKYADLGLEEAQARAEYDAAKYSAALEMRMQGESATNINNMLRGRPDVNGVMLKYMTAKTRREATLEVINILKLELKLMDLGL